MANGDDAERGRLSGAIRGLRKRLRGARTRRKAAKNKRQRLVERKKQKVKQAVQPAQDEADRVSDEARLLAAELGVGTGRAKEIAEQGSNALQRAGERGGDVLDRFDTDGDGDTDLLDSLDPEGGFEAVSDGRQSVENELGFDDDFQLEDDIGLEGPVEDEF